MTDIIETLKDDYIVVVQNDDTVIQFPDPTIITVEDESIVEHEVENVIVIETAGEQGPPGPPTGINTCTAGLNFIGESTGPNQTTTEAVGTRILEAFDVGDELWTQYVIPDEFDRTQDIQVFIMLFTMEQQPDATKDSSWQIDVTSHSHVSPYQSITLSEYITDTSIKEDQYEHVHAWVYLDKTTYDFANINTLTFRLERLASSNTPTGKVGIAGIELRFGTDGRAGAAGATGPQGPSGDESVPLAKQIDWIDDEHVYIGEANPGTITSAASWRIKYTVFQSDDDAAITWADGDDSFDNVWDNRVSLSYS